MTRLRTTTLAAALLAAGAAAAAAQGYGSNSGYGAGSYHATYGSYGTGAAAYGTGYGSYGYRGDEIDARRARQAERIERGYRDGSLTQRESAGLAEQQRRIAEFERRAKADGYLDPYERATLRQMQDEASRSIHRERTDYEGRNAAFDRPWWRRWW